MAQRRKGVLWGGVGRPLAPFGSAVRSALGSESEFSSPLADLSAAGYARLKRTLLKVALLA